MSETNPDHWTGDPEADRLTRVASVVTNARRGDLGDAVVQYARRAAGVEPPAFAPPEVQQ